MESFVAFSGAKLLSRGPLATLLPQVHERAQSAAHELVFIQESTGRSVDFDWRGSLEEVIERAQEQWSEPGAKTRGRGRPRLGVQSREVTLLPRHWSWLDRQRGSRSAVLRRLLDQEMKRDEGPNLDAIYGAMSILAGDRAHFEEASRALFARDWSAFAEHIQSWPRDLVHYFSSRIQVDQADA